MSKTREERLEYLRADCARRDREREEAERVEDVKRAEKRKERNRTYYAKYRKELCAENRARYLKEREKRGAYCHAHLKERAEWLRKRRLLLKQHQSKPESGVDASL